MSPSEIDNYRSNHTIIHRKSEIHLSYYCVDSYISSHVGILHKMCREMRCTFVIIIILPIPAYLHLIVFVYNL